MDEIKIKTSNEDKVMTTIILPIFIVFMLVCICSRVKFNILYLTPIFIIFGYMLFLYLTRLVRDIVFDKEKVTVYNNKKKTVYYWRDLYIIRYVREEYLLDSKIEEYICFSKKKRIIKLWFDNMSDITVKNRDTFFVKLISDTRKIDGWAYPKYEFLDKLKEWGVKIEIDEKYIKKDPTLEKYVSVDNKEDIQESYSPQNNQNEWNININNKTYILKIHESNEQYRIIVNDTIYKNIDKKKANRRNIEEKILIDNEEYLVVRFNRKFSVVRKGRHIDDNRIYVSKLKTWLILLVGVLSIVAALFIRYFNLFPKYNTIIVVVLAMIAMITSTVVRFIRYKR